MTDLWATCLGSATAGLISRIYCHPLDTIKARLQARGGDWDFGIPKPRLPPPVTRLDPSHCAYLNPAVRPPNYFEGLASQRPRGKEHIYFIKVDAAWRGGFAYMHLRVRVVQPERTPLGVPCAIPPLQDSRFVLEGIQSNLAAMSPIDVFEPNLSRDVLSPNDHQARLARTGMTF